MYILHVYILTVFGFDPLKPLSTGHLPSWKPPSRKRKTQLGHSSRSARASAMHCPAVVKIHLPQVGPKDRTKPADSNVRPPAVR